jgi:hypothetical protein
MCRDREVKGGGPIRAGRVNGADSDALVKGATRRTCSSPSCSQPHRMLTSSSQHEFRYNPWRPNPWDHPDRSDASGRDRCLESLLYLLKRELGCLSEGLEDMLKGKKRVLRDSEQPSTSKRQKLDGSLQEIPAFRHTFDLLPSELDVDEDKYILDTIKQIELVLRNYGSEDGVTLDGVALEGASRVIQKGQKRHTSASDRVVLHVAHDDIPDDIDSRLLSLPNVPGPGNLDDYDFAEKDTDLLRASLALHGAGRLALDCKLRLRPREESPKFQLEVEITGSLIVTTMFDTPQSNSLAEAQRRILHHVYSQHIPPSTTDTDIALFYSSLQPAESPLISSHEPLAQHKLLKPTLLPFQRRSTLKLLELEKKSLTPNGQLIDADTVVSRQPFWQAVPYLGEGEESSSPANWFFNRLTGELRDADPGAGHSVTGALLAEEMGLGMHSSCNLMIKLS